ncbi:MAG: ADOP family duplicated permease, partial [Candidatus Acidiferrales bacterium]
IRKGMSPDEARREALVRMGARESIKQQHRELRALPFVDKFLADLRFALRMLSKTPGLTIVAVLTLMLGIGANTAIFSLTDQILLRNLPVPNPQQLVVLRSPGPHNGHCWSDVDDNCAQSFSYPMYKALHERATVFSGLLAYRGVDVNVSGQGATQSARGALVSGNYFQTLQVQPALGRLLTSSDETAPGENTVAVLSFGYWSKQFGADPTILNKSLIVNGVAFTVVGVARGGFTGIQLGEVPDIFIPVTMKSQMMPTEGHQLEDRGDFWLPLLARLKPGISRAQAQTSLQPIYASLLKEDAQVRGGFPSDLLKRYTSMPLFLAAGAHGRMVLQAGTEQPLLVLMSMVGLVLLIACANLAGLLVARGEARQREIAVRLALGASRARLIRQLLTESLLIAIAGGVAGIALASWCLKAMIGAIPASQGMNGLATTLDLPVLWFAIGLTLAATILSGLAPAIRATRLDLHFSLKEQGASVTGGRPNVTLRKVLIVSQVALTTVLLAGAGLFAHTLANLEHASLGLNAGGILQFSVSPDLNGNTSAQTREFADDALREIAALSGVRSVSTSTISMFADDDMGFNITPQGYNKQSNDDTNALATYIGPNYFSTLGIPLIRGREFTGAESATGPKVCIINEKLALRFFAGRNPIGLKIARGAGKNVVPDIEIVGVVADSKWDSARSDITPFIYMPYPQEPNLGHLMFYVRTDLGPNSEFASIRSTINRLDPNLPVNDMRTLAAQIDSSMFDARLVAALSVSLALLAALMAAIGLYGVLSYLVARRTREIGIRRALGAQRANILTSVLWESFILTLVGIAIGLPCALGAARFVQSMLFGLSGADLVTLSLTLGTLLIIGIGAGYFPARRAMNVDPMVALRYE